MFEGPKLKVKWANEHINNLNLAIRKFVDSDFYSLSVDKDSNAVYSIKLIMKMQPPEVISLLIGDAAHNLRAAIDFLACDIVRAEGGVVNEHTRFPLRPKKEELVGALNGGKKAGSKLAEFSDLIVNEIQPYIGGNGAALYDLHRLDVLDKHILLVPVFSVVQLDGVDAIDANRCLVRGMRLGVSANGIVRPVSSTAPMEITNYGQPSFTVSFAQGQPFEGKSIVPTLAQLSQLVIGVIGVFEKAYAKRNA